MAKKRVSEYGAQMSVGWPKGGIFCGILEIRGIRGSGGRREIRDSRTRHGYLDSWALKDALSVFRSRRESAWVNGSGWWMGGNTRLSEPSGLVVNMFVGVQLALVRDLPRSSKAKAAWTAMAMAMVGLLG
jgi:hypothetical protein